MRKIYLLLVLTLAASGYAQTDSSLADDVAVIQSIYGKSKADLVKQYMNLSEPQATAFQTVYDGYETQRKGLGQKKMQLINDYAANYDNLDDAKAAELTETNLKNTADSEKLLHKTFGKIKKAVAGRNAAKFVQLEQYLQTTIRGEIQDSIPFIDEIDKSKISK